MGNSSLFIDILVPLSISVTEGPKCQQTFRQGGRALGQGALWAGIRIELPTLWRDGTLEGPPCSTWTVNIAAQCGAVSSSSWGICFYSGVCFSPFSIPMRFWDPWYHQLSEAELQIFWFCLPLTQGSQEDPMFHHLAGTHPPYPSSLAWALWWSWMSSQRSPHLATY